jgi:hypothetical protein
MKKTYWTALFLTVVSTATVANETHHPAGEESVAAQNSALEKNTDNKGYGPQSPRDLSSPYGANDRVFSAAPSYRKMNLCNIHFHENAEHKGGEFTTFAGAGDGHGNHTGYKYSGKLNAKQSIPLTQEVCQGKHGGLQVGDTIELHYVHSSAQVQPGPTLSACLSEADINPQLRVEAQILVLVNDARAVDFGQLTKVGEVKGYQQALHLPTRSGKPVQYAGSTTGPTYNEKGSPLQVSWSVRPRVLKVDAQSVGRWCQDNVFDEDHAHGVRNLIINKKLLSRMP